MTPQITKDEIRENLDWLAKNNPDSLLKLCTKEQLAELVAAIAQIRLTGESTKDLLKILKGSSLIRSFDEDVIKTIEENF